MSEQQHKVGDELAFYHFGGSGRWSIHRITKITPSGRIRCGYYELNPDLTIRGRDPWSNEPDHGEPVTDEIRGMVKRQELIVRAKYLARFDWERLTDGQLEAILAIIKEASQ
jgi:hypothetical protein